MVSLISFHEAEGFVVSITEDKPAVPILAIGVMVCSLLAACAPVTPAEDQPSESTPSAPTEPERETSSVPNPLPDFVTAKGVVLASVIIATGNVASAIEQGMVSPQEVEWARKAIAEGTLQDWVDAAEKESP